MMMTGLFGAVLMAAFGTYYFRNKKTYRRRALLCKALATSVPGFLLLRYLYEVHTGTASGGGLSGQAGSMIPGAAYAATLAAIIFYMAADVLLECVFVWGAVSFGIGHVCMAAGLLLSGESVLKPDGNGGVFIDVRLFWLTVTVYVLFVAVACVVLGRYFHALKKKRLFYPLLAYMFILSMMAALAVAAGVSGCCTDGGISAARGAITAAGGICFAVSDVLLGRNRLGKRRSMVCGALVLILYYASVYFFAMRLWL